MAETSPPPTAGAESCSEEPARGGKQRPEEPRRAPAGGADREDEAGPPLASPAGQSEPGSPVAAPFFLLYPGDGGAGFVARPPPQQQRSWRTPPSPGSPLPFLLLNYPSGGGGGGGKHREWRRGREMPAGKGGLGRKGQSGCAELRLPQAPRSGAGRRASGEAGALGAALRKLASGGAGVAGVRGTAAGRAPDCLPPSLPRPQAPARPPHHSPPGPGVRPCQPPTCSRITAPGFGWESSREESRRGRRPEPGPPGRSAGYRLPAPRPPSRCGCCAAAAARVASVGPLNFLRAFSLHP